MNHSENDSKQLIYNERKAFVQKMWSRYSHTLDDKGGNGDYRLLAEICEKYLTKGDKVYCEGKLKNKQWEQEGVKRYATEVHVTEMTFLSTKKSLEKSATQISPENQTTTPATKKTVSPEIKFSYGITNLHQLDRGLKYSNVLDKLQSRMIVFSIHLED